MDPFALVPFPSLLVLQGRPGSTGPRADQDLSTKHHSAGNADHIPGSRRAKRPVFCQQSLLLFSRDHLRLCRP